MTFGNFTGKSSGEEDYKMADSSLLNKRQGTLLTATWKAATGALRALFGPQLHVKEKKYIIICSN